jgi:RNA polymerase sigma-70 factor (ECF subfamily)
MGMGGMQSPSDSSQGQSNVVALATADARVPTTEFHRGWRALEQRGARPAEFVTLAFDHCHAMVFSIANRITSSRWEAEDVTQAVFESLLERLDKVRDHDRIPGFLRTCAVRISLRHVQRSRWRRSRLEEAMPVLDDAATNDPVGIAALVRQLLARLDPEERAAVVLKYVELCSHDEVAELMGVSVATARRRLDSGRRKLAALVGERRVDEILGEAAVAAGGAP